jgi:nucleotide-binding universal stress UspA family protein
MPSNNPLNYEIAVQDFKRSRRQAAVQQLLARLTGKSTELLAYDYVRRQLGETGTIERGLQEIPLDAIVGSVGRHDDFTQDFLPKKDSDLERWARIKAAILDMSGMGPIEVYQVGDGYFVNDGHHRVSVARQLGTSTISAYVVEVKTKVPLAIDDDLDAVSCKARYVEFLAETKLDEVRPEANLLLTLCDDYDGFLAQIDAHHRRLSEEEQRDIPYQEAVAQWYDQVYQPIKHIIRQQGILRNFPERTEADLYLLFVEHKEELVQALGWHVDSGLAVADLARQKTNATRGVRGWLGLQLYELLIPDEFEAGPEPGQWREGRLARRKDDTLFADVLVGVQQEKAKWRALDQAVTVAKWESGRLFGLHVVSDMAADNSKVIGAVRSDFEQRCRAEGLVGEFAVEVGGVADMILKRAAWADLVVVRMAHPPKSEPLTRISPGFNKLVQQCPRPILVVPSGAHSPMDRALLAYDGSPKANEALFVATYLASRWPISLTVVTAEPTNTPPDALQQAKAYLDEHGVVDVTYSLNQKSTAEAILEVATASMSNLLIMGAFSFRPVLNLVLGSTADQILRDLRQPVLICR